MIKKTKKKEKSSSLKKRLNKSYESKDKGGTNRPQAFDWSKVPNIKFYKPKDGKNKIDIIPYVIKTKNDPMVHSGDSEIGEQNYVFDVFVHKYIGPSSAEVFCPKQVGKPCPICKQAQEFKDAGKKAEASALWPKRTCYYNVIDQKNPEEGLQVFAISHFLFEKELIEEARASADNDGDIVDFPDIDDGKTITFRAAETSTVIGEKSTTYLKYKSFQFIDRDDPLDESLIDDAVSFDELVKVLPAAEIETLLVGEDDVEDDEPKSSKSKKPAPKSSKHKPVKDDEDEDEDEDDEDEDEDEDDEDEDEDDEDEDDEDEDDDDDEEDKPSPPVKKSAGRPAKEKPAPAKAAAKTTSKVSKDKCPAGHVFGKDCNKFEDDCDECDEWDKCLLTQNLMKKKGK